MRSSLPKPLHRLAGKPLIEWVLDSMVAAHAKDAMIVVGADGSQVHDHVQHINDRYPCALDTVIQDPAPRHRSRGGSGGGKITISGWYCGYCLCRYAIDFC